MKRINKKLIAIIVILIILLIGLGIGIYFYYFSEKIEIKKDRFVFEYGKEVPFTTNYYLKDTKRMPHKKDYKITVKNQNKVEIKNKKIVTKGGKILEVGTYTLEISYQKQKETFVVEVKDTTKPTFKTAPEKITLEQNSKDVDLTKFFESEDLSETKLTIQGDYDLSTLGNYELKIQASDLYRNTQEKSFILEVIDFLEAGSITEKEVENGKAIEISTGAAMPKGADAVVMVEYCEKGENEVNILKSATPGLEVAKKGSDTEKGKLILKKGDVLTPGRIGVLLSQGFETVKVYKKPSVGVISSGNELINPGEELTYGKIYDVNGNMIKSDLTSAGAE